MLTFTADLHIHSRFSRATSKQLNPLTLAAWASCKGIDVLATGDFTHPQWRAELREHLCLDEESGFYRLTSPAPLREIDIPFVPPFVPATASDTLFCLQAEISSIYKRHGKVRKVHNLVYAPTLEDADRIADRLACVGNLSADGRPILGLDSRDLLEIVLEAAPHAVLIPAHIWTPWFSLFGSKSGFDRLTDCFGDLSSHIFALETGLSSDPAMNRLVSRLDNFALISNSDAHSPANLGREANLFAGRPSFTGLFTALRAAAARRTNQTSSCLFLGTLEFCPEEGKYHLDGHRACNVVFEPHETLALNNICPVCSKSLTIGVLHRVLALADRESPPELPLEPSAKPLIPLPELLSEILGVGPESRKVHDCYIRLLRDLGPELRLLCLLPEADIRARWDVLGEAVARMRRGNIIRSGGFDGQYGSARVFTPEELRDIRAGSKALPGFAMRSAPQSFPATDMRASARLQKYPSTALEERPVTSLIFHEQGGLSEEQRTLLAAGPAPVLVLAGPGAGKTRILTGRLQWLLEHGVEPRRIVALTFTRRAAGELRERLSRALPHMREHLPRCDTLHALAYSVVQTHYPKSFLLTDDASYALFAAANPAVAQRDLRRLWDIISLARETGGTLAEVAQLAVDRYNQRKTANPEIRLLDYQDLLESLLAHLPTLPPAERPLHVLVDEVQDLSPVQLELVRAMLSAGGQGFFGIGDPDQAIYGFRGAGQNCAAVLADFWPQLSLYRLGQSYRSGQAILTLAQTLLGGRAACAPLNAVRRIDCSIHFLDAPDDQAEADAIARRIQRLLGGTSHTLLDQMCSNGEDRATGDEPEPLSPSDIAVLVRLKAQMPVLRRALERAGIPCAAPAEENILQDPVCGRLLKMAAAHCGFANLSVSLGPLLPADDTILVEDLPWTAGFLPSPTELFPWLARQPWAGEHISRSRAWREVCSLFQECGDWEELFRRLIWLQEAELARSKAEQVQILTLHASKGLEFEAVFLPGLENGLLPLRRGLLLRCEDKATADRPTAQTPADNREDESGEDGSDVEDERRLLYVGLTRAARVLFLSRAAQRVLWGTRLRLALSPFLNDIKQFCRPSALVKYKRAAARRLSLLSVMGTN
ncbi:DNA helicase [Deltaproteobacteria bacterium]|nr:DNA helicase [Deltaproteobacteria bacterium]